MNLNTLMRKLRAITRGRYNTITQRERGDGSSSASMEIDGKIVATWQGRLKNQNVPRDGVTPRGPKDYYDFVVIQ